MIEVFDRIAWVDWSKIRTTHGDTVGKTTMLKDIRLYFSNDMKDRYHATLIIEQNCVLQGTLSECAFFITSLILLHLQEHPESISNEALTLLVEVALGVDPSECIILVGGIPMDLRRSCSALIKSGLPIYKKSLKLPHINKEELKVLIEFCSLELSSD